MTRKALNVFVELNIHAVTCPGVWLNPNGKVLLRVAMLGTTVRTSRVPPVFPMLFHSKFIFQKTLSDVCRLRELEKALAGETLAAQLVQCNGQERLLATFETSVLELLYPVPLRQDLVCGVDVDLLMEPSSAYPGILGPKIEVSTKTTIEEVTNNAKHNKFVINPKMVSSKTRKQGPLSGQSSSQPRYCTRWRHKQRTAGKPSVRGGTAHAQSAGRAGASDDVAPWTSASGQLFHADTYRQVLEESRDRNGCTCNIAEKVEAKQSACRGYSADISCQVCHAYNKYFNPQSLDRRVHFPQTSKKTLPSSSSGSSHRNASSSNMRPSTVSHTICQCTASVGVCPAGSGSCSLTSDQGMVPRNTSRGSSREVFYRDLERFYSKLHHRYQTRSRNSNLVCT